MGQLALVEAEQLAQLHLDELHQFLVLNSVDLVQEDDERWNADLAAVHRAVKAEQAQA